MNRFVLLASALLIFLIVLLVALMVCGLVGCYSPTKFISGLINSTCGLIFICLLGLACSFLSKRIKVPIPKSLSAIGICTAVLMIIAGSIFGFVSDWWQHSWHYWIGACGFD
jgi:hypothetical protein